MSTKIDTTTGKIRASLLLIIRNNTAAELEKLNPILARGEPAYAHDTGVFAVGDGEHTWAQLTTVSPLTNRLATARTINGVSFDGSAAISNYGICNSDSTSAVKDVTIPGFNYVEGALVLIHFAKNNASNSYTLRINTNNTYNGIACPIKFNGSTISGASFLKSGYTYAFVLHLGNTASSHYYEYIGGHTNVSGNALAIGSGGLITSDLALNYDSEEQEVTLSANNTIISRIDVSDFVKDSFLEKVEVVDTTKLKFTWNTIVVDSDGNNIPDSTTTIIDVADLIDVESISADNVIFSEDLTYTANIGALTLPSGASSGTLNAKDKSLTNVMKTILAKRLQPNISSMAPSAGFSSTSISYTANVVNTAYSSLDTILTTENDTTEIGNTITGVTVKTTFSPGTYLYGYCTNADGTGKTTTPNSSTGLTATSTNITCSKTIKQGTPSGTLNSTGQTVKLTFSSAIAIDSTSAKTYATVYNSVSYGASTRYPLDNLGDRASTGSDADGDGKDDLMNPVAGGSVSTSNVTVRTTAHRSKFYYVGTKVPASTTYHNPNDTNKIPTTLTADFIRTKGISTKGANIGTIKIYKGTKQVAFAVPGIYYLSEVKDSAGLGTSVHGNFGRTTINMPGAGGRSSTLYSVFYAENPNGWDETTYTPTFTTAPLE